jgi:uncharacterized protein YndB with AHSA1/START domain
MDNEKKMTIERVFDAPREKVWRAWTDPAELAQWWGPNGVTVPECRVEAHAGGELYAVMLAGKELGPMAGQRWPTKGTFKEVVKNERLVFTNDAVAEDGTILIEGETSVFLEDAGEGKTKMTLTVHAKGVAPQAPQMLAGMQQGWTESIGKLGALVG